MRKFLLAGLAVLAFASIAAAASSRQNVGCGLGTMIFGDKDNSTLIQAFAATTNGTLGNQTFGITSGTSECQKPANFVMNDRTKEYIRSNMDGLARDISRGGGETVEALAELLNVEKDARPAFYGSLQKNFDSIFPSRDVNYSHVADAISALGQG